MMYEMALIVGGAAVIAFLLKDNFTPDDDYAVWETGYKTSRLRMKNIAAFISGVNPFQTQQGTIQRSFPPWRPWDTNPSVLEFKLNNKGTEKINNTFDTNYGGKKKEWINGYNKLETFPEQWKTTRDKNVLTLEVEGIAAYFEIHYIPNEELTKKQKSIGGEFIKLFLIRDGKGNEYPIWQLIETTEGEIYTLDQMEYLNIYIGKQKHDTPIRPRRLRIVLKKGIKTRAEITSDVAQEEVKIEVTKLKF